MSNDNKYLPIPDTPECFLSHMGAWIMAPATLQTLVSAWQTGKLAAASKQQMEDNNDGRYAPNIQNGIQIIDIYGVMRPMDSKFGNTVSTVELRKQFRRAAANKAVDGVLLNCQTPGGSVAGIAEFIDDLNKLCAAKPVWSFVSEYTFSAGYWAVSQTQKIIGNKTSQVGSIGVIAMMVDDSKAMEKAGIKVIPVTTGSLKASGYPGVEVSDEAIAEVQDIVNEYFDMFKAAVMSGRGMNDEQFKKVSTGGVWTASKGIKLGLLDQIADFDTAFNSFRAYLDKGEYNLKTVPNPAASASAFPPNSPDAAGVLATTEVAAEKPLSDTALNNLPTNQGEKTMNQQEIQAVAGKFKCLGAKGMDYLAQGIDFEAAATQELGAKDAAITALQAENTNLKAQFATEQAAHGLVKTELAAIKAQAPQIPAGSVPADAQAKKPEEKAEGKDPVAEFNACVKVKTDAGMKPADARAAVYKDNPELTAAYEAAFPAPKGA